MAFAEPIPRPFNERGIWVYAPSASGVFGLSNSKGWIHVGESADIRAALLNCLHGNNPKLHVPEYRKTWLACAAHRTSLGNFLDLRGVLREVTPFGTATDAPIS